MKKLQAIVVLVVLAGCSGGVDPDYARFQLVYDGIPFFSRDIPRYDEAAFAQFADDNCGLDDGQLGRLYDSSAGDGTQIYLLLAFACGDEVADRAMDASAEPADGRQTIRTEYRRDYSTIERARARVQRAVEAG